MSQKTFRILCGVVILFTVVQMPARKAFGEFYPALFMPSFSAVPPGHDKPINLKQLSFEITWQGGLTRDLRFAEVFGDVLESHHATLTAKFRDTPGRVPPLARFVPAGLFPGYRAQADAWYENPDVRHGLGLHLKERVERLYPQNGPVDRIDVVWTQETYTFNGGSIAMESSPDARFTFFEAEAR